jgi:hypothetical protein
MIQQAIKLEMARRRWSARRLAIESGARHSALTDYLAGRRDISLLNAEKALFALGLRFPQSVIPIYLEQLKCFSGTIWPYGEIDPDVFAHLLLGTLVSIAGNFLQEEMPGRVINFGDIWDRFVAQEEIPQGGIFVDIHSSIKKRDFARIAYTHFTARQKAAVDWLTKHELSPYCDREQMAIMVITGITSKIEI